MVHILNIDTSSFVCSVCLTKGGEFLAERNNLIENNHASELTMLISDLLSENNVSLKDLAAIAVSSGPGSYTGLRIGTSVAKGICYALNKPLIAVPTLQGLAHRMAEICPDPEGIYVALLDARHNNVYMAIYDSENNVLQADRFIELGNDFYDTLSVYNVKNVYFGGPGVTKKGIMCVNKEFGTVIENLICVAKNMKFISYKRFIENMSENIAYFEPFYLKEFEGRIKIN